MRYPELVEQYLKFCSFRMDALINGTMDLSNQSFFFPATLLPLSLFLREKIKLYKYKKPKDPNVAKYLDIIKKRQVVDRQEFVSYLPIVALPREMNRFNPVFSRICDIAGDVGGKNAFRYFLGELTDNIYQHSNFHNALVMAQKYERRGEMHITIIDDGITIPGSLNGSGLFFGNDLDSITEAIQGASAKGDRGRGMGLGSSIKVLTKGYRGRVCVISRQGGIHFSEKEQRKLSLSEDFMYNGTLIAIVVPLRLNKEVDIYGFAD
jgi:hypothetical protein